MSDFKNQLELLSQSIRVVNIKNRQSPTYDYNPRSANPLWDVVAEVEGFHFHHCHDQTLATLKLKRKGVCVKKNKIKSHRNKYLTPVHWSMTGLEGLKQFWNDSQIIQIPKLTKLELKSYQAENTSLEISWRPDFQICICIIEDKYRETLCL